MKVLYCIAVLAWSCTVLPIRAQRLVLRGEVVLHNSRYMTGRTVHVSDARVRAPFAKAVTTDTSGLFVLSFNGVEAGVPVRLTVDKPGFEVVNSRDIYQVILGNMRHLQVILAEPAVLNARREVLYKVSTQRIRSTFERHAKVLNDTNRTLLHRIEEIGMSNADSVETLGEAIDLLTAQRDQALEHAFQLADELAVVDLDGASLRFRQAYGCFERGRIDSTLALLDPDHLEADYRNAVAERAKGGAVVEAANNTFRQLHESHLLKAVVLEADLRYRACIQVLRNAQRMEEEQQDAFDPLDKITLLVTIARQERVLGMADEAAADIEAAFAMAQSALPAEHLYWSDLYGARSRVLSELGRPAEALEASRSALEILLRSLGPMDPEVGVAYHDLATDCYNNGDYRAALQNSTKALTILDSVAHRDPSMIGMVCNSMAYALLGNGDLKGALAMAERSLAILRATRPPGDPDLGGAYAAVAYMQYNLGSFDEALAAMDQALQSDLSTFGRIHPAIALRYNSLGVLRSSMGDNTGALQAYEECLFIRSKILGADHPDVLLTEMNLGLTLSDMGRYTEAGQRLRVAHEKVRLALGPEHPSAAIALGNLGLNALRSGALDTAMNCYQRALEVFSKAHPDGHPQIAATYANMAAVFDAQGRTTEAIDHSRKAYAMACASIGSESPQAAQYDAHLGAMFWTAAQMDSSLLHYQRSRVVALKVLGPSDPLVGRASGGTAMALAALGVKADSLVTMAREGTAILRAVYGEQHTETAHAHAASGFVLSKSDALEEALAEYTQALDFYRSSEKAFGMDISETQLQIGRVLYALQRPEQAMLMLDSSFIRTPSAGAAWLQYRIAMDRGDAALALDRLVHCARLKDRWSGAAEAQKQEAMDALRLLATQQGRLDLLEEFHPR